jgi:ribose 5-phosphate isomerase A
MSGGTGPDALKREAAAQAAAMVENGMVVGLGTGSTAAFFIEALIARRPDIVCIPTSERSAAQASAGGLKVVGFDTHTVIDLCVDGADEIKRDSLDLVKGLGGALLREKMVASAARRLVIIADGSKMVDWLGSRAPVPVEVTRFGWELTQSRLADLAQTVQRRMLPEDGGPYVTDGGNFIIDCFTGPIAEAATLDRQMRQIVGVVETGLFIAMAELALVADGQGITKYKPQ